MYINSLFTNNQPFDCISFVWKVLLCMELRTFDIENVSDISPIWPLSDEQRSTLKSQVYLLFTFIKAATSIFFRNRKKMPRIYLRISISGELNRSLLYLPDLQIKFTTLNYLSIKH